MWQTIKDGGTWARFFAARLAEAVFGEVDWTPPNWLKSLGRRLRRAWRPLLAIMLVGIGAWQAWDWWQSRPRIVPPEALVATLQEPATTNYGASPPVVSPLVLQFNHAAKPIDAKDIAPGFALVPELPGRWTWTTETSVAFQPSGDWPIGRPFRIRIEGDACCAKTRPFGEHDLRFTTAAFSAWATSPQFYQDPTDPRVKRALFDLVFSHPVDPATLETRVAFALADAKGGIIARPEFHVTYAPNRLSARVQTAPLTLPAEGGEGQLQVDAGVRSVLGGDASPEPVRIALPLPARNSLAVQTVETTIVTDARGSPEQVLVIGFNQEVDERVLLPRLKFRLLPVREPGPGEDTAEWWLGQIPEKVAKSAQELSRDLIPGEREVADTHTFRISLDPGRQVLVDIDGGLTSFGEFVMPKKHQALVAAPDYPRMLQFVGEGALLSLRGERRVSIAMRNTPLAQLTVARVRPDELHHLVRFNDGTMAMPSLRNLGRDDLSERFDTYVEAPEGQARSSIHYAGVDLGQYFEAGGHGVFLLSLRAISEEERAARGQEESDPFDQYAYYEDSDLVDRRLVVLSDLGVVAKKQKDGQRRVFVSRLQSGGPVADAMVSVLARNGARVLAVQTGADGAALLPSLDEYRRERDPVLLLVESGGDTTFLPLNDWQRQVDFSRFDIGGEETPVDGGQLRAHLFSDRGLYRPGETLHVGAIVRREDWQALPEGAPLELQLTDPRGQVLSMQAMALAPGGFHEFPYTLSEIAPTGTYTATLLQWLDAERTQSRHLGATNLRVKEFQPDRMKVTSRFAPVTAALWLKPGDLKIEVGVEHLFGGAAVGRPVDTTLRLRPADRVLPGFEDWLFAATDAGFAVHETPLARQTTDDTGAAVFDAGLAGIETAHYQVDVMVEAFELEGGRSVKSDLTTRISQADWLLGIKAGETGLALSRHAERSLHWLAIDAQGKPVDPAEVRFEIAELRYVSILTRGDDGLYRYESRLRERPVSARALVFQGGKAQLPLPTDEPGEYRVRVFDGTQSRLAEVGFSVAGTGNAARALERNAELKAKLLDAEPEAGDTLQLSIEAPYAGSGLITIERERVLAHAWFTTTETRSVQSIRLPPGLEGQAYVTVQLLRAIDSPEIFMSPASHAAVPFRVRPTARTIGLVLDAASKHRPGQDLPVTLRSTHPARVALFAVDEGILQVAGYRLVDPNDRFFAKRQLEVETAQILDLVLPEFSLLSSAAGGDAEGALARHLNPFKRQLDKPAVYWAGLRDVDGEAQWSVPVPDSFNGRLRIMAVAVNAERIGIGHASTEVRAPFVLIPTAPATVAPGDEFELGLSIQREGGTGDPATTLTVDAGSGFSVVGDTTQRITLAPGAESSHRLRLKAAEQLGAGTIRLRVASGPSSSERVLGISVRPLTPYSGRRQFGRFDGPKRDITGLRNLWPDFAKRELIAGHTPLVMIGGLNAQLEDFPHQCSEQVLSQAMGRLLLVRYPDYAAAPVPAAQWQALFDLLRARTNSAGGLGLWVPEEDADVFASAWAGLFFLEAEAVGIGVPPDLVSHNLGYLRRFAGDGVEATRFEHWLALYVRARRGEVVTLPMQDLLQSEPEDARDGIASRSLAAAIHALHQDRRSADAALKPVLAEFRNELKAADYGFDAYLNPVMARNLALLVVYRHFPARARDLPANAMAHLELAVQQDLLNTVSSGSAALALMAQAEHLGDQAGAGDLSLQWQAADKTSGTFGEARAIDRRGAWPEVARTLSIGNAGPHPTWFAMRESGFARTLPTVAAHAGLELARDYTGTDGKPLAKIAVGDEIEVSLRLRATDLRHGNLAVVELLPAGFELVEFPVDEYAPRAARFVATEQGDLAFLDAREDRMVLYVSASESMQVYRYRLKATSRGSFAVPPTFAEDMYDARRTSLGASGQRLAVD